MEDSLENVLQQHIRSYPGMALIDCIKLLYQNEFGAEHLLEDRSDAESRLLHEYQAVCAEGKRNIPIFESIGGGLCRMHINASAFSVSWLALAGSIFCATAAKKRGDMRSFGQKLELLLDLCSRGLLTEDISDIRSALDAYRQSGCPAVSHSQIYRSLYHPHYRIVDRRFADTFPAFTATEKLGRADARCIIAIDGRCAGGKTTLANLLGEIFDCNIFRMDEFFLPPEMRTQERLSKPGGNIHYERFLSEVLLPLYRGESVVYRPFSCQKGEIGQSVSVPPKKINIVEGSYALHPALVPYYTYKIFLHIDPQTQYQRLLVREGNEGAEMYANHWIPLEEAYFSGFQIRSHCDLVIHNLYQS